MLLASHLEAHTNRDLVNYVLQGLSCGFNIGFSGEITGSKPKNLLSALQHGVGVEQAIIKELERGHTSGPFSVPHTVPL